MKITIELTEEQVEQIAQRVAQIKGWHSIETCKPRDEEEGFYLRDVVVLLLDGSTCEAWQMTRGFWRRTNTPRSAPNAYVKGVTHWKEIE